MGATVGVVGVGNMGLPMALRLREAGYAVVVRDVLGEREALACVPMPSSGAGRIAASPADLAGRCDLIIVAVVDAMQVREVVLGSTSNAAGLVAAARPGMTVMLCSTIAPYDVEALNLDLKQRGVSCIDAPMSGGPQRARDGSMSLMLAADAEVLQRWDAVLGVLSAQRHHISTRPGDGARTKLVNNLLAAVNLCGAAEAMALAQRMGLDPQRTLQVIEGSSGASWIGSDRMRRALADDLEPRAHTSLLAKDSSLAVAMARAADFEPRIGATAASMFANACAAGFSHHDDASLVAWLQGTTSATRR